VATGEGVDRRPTCIWLGAKTEETFQNNNFAYTGEKAGVHVTLLEKNYINPLRPNTYEATFVYLIRNQGESTIHTGHHAWGAFLMVNRLYHWIFPDRFIEKHLIFGYLFSAF
jgi:hypothetical protein